MFLGFGVKAALVPFHSWLPAAMVAPTPVSALLHAVAVVKSGIFAIIRMSYFIFGAEIIKAASCKYIFEYFNSNFNFTGFILSIASRKFKKEIGLLNY